MEYEPAGVPGGIAATPAIYAHEETGTMTVPEARRVIDTLASIKHPRDLVLDAIECLDRLPQCNSRDKRRRDAAAFWIEDTKDRVP
jgi:hypothetical protein